MIFVVWFKTKLLKWDGLQWMCKLFFTYFFGVVFWFTQLNEVEETKKKYKKKTSYIKEKKWTQP